MMIRKNIPKQRLSESIGIAPFLTSIREVKVHTKIGLQDTLGNAWRLQVFSEIKRGGSFFGCCYGGYKR